MSYKPFSPACDRNKSHILRHLISILNNSRTVLEIGSGTGQHAIYFAKHLPHIVWQTSDLPENHQGIANWIEEANIENVKPPILFDVSSYKGNLHYDAIFTANTFHIMSWDNVISCIEIVSNILVEGGVFIVYGPFNIDNQYTSKSNKEFDLMLKAKDQKMGIRDLNEITSLCKNNNLNIKEIIDMPANNKMLYVEKL